MSNKSKVVIVTGGASGIGFAFVKHLAKLGYQLVIADLRGAQEAAEKIKADGYSAIGVTADVVNPDQVKSMVDDATKAFGGVDVLVNNAGLFTSLALKPFDQITDKEWMRVMEVNTLGPFICVKAVVPSMRSRGGGRIINIASIVPMKGAPMMLHYVASKGAVIAMTRSLARELGNDKITVNAVAPGFTLSDGVLENGLHSKMPESSRTTGRCIQRDQVPEDLVGAVGFLSGEGAGFITGQTLAVDGGVIFL